MVKETDRVKNRETTAQNDQLNGLFVRGVVMSITAVFNVFSIAELGFRARIAP